MNCPDVTFTLRFLLIFWPISDFAVFLFSRTRLWPQKPRKIEAREKNPFYSKANHFATSRFFPIVEVSGNQGREIRTEAQPCHSHVRTPSFRFSRFVIFAFRGSLEKQYKRQQTLHFDIKREEKFINYHDVTFTLRYLLIFWPISNFAVFLFSRTRVWPRKL